MKILKLLASLIIMTSVIMACGKDDDNNEPTNPPANPTPKKMLVSEYKIRHNGAYKPYWTFTYNNDNLLTSAIVNKYDDNTTTLYSFEWNSNKKLTKVTSKENESNRDYFIVKYNDTETLIEYVDVYDTENPATPKETLHYFWWNNQITKIERVLTANQQKDTIRFGYLGNNHYGIEIQSSKSINGINVKTTNATQNKFNEQRTNWLPCIPIEFFIVTKKEKAGGIICSKSIITNESIAFAEAHGTNSEYIFNENMQYSYIYDSNGWPSSIATNYNTFEKLTDNQNSDNNFEKNTGPFDTYYTIKYIEPK